MHRAQSTQHTRCCSGSRENDFHFIRCNYFLISVFGQFRTFKQCNKWVCGRETHCSFIVLLFIADYDFAGCIFIYYIQLKCSVFSTTSIIWWFEYEFCSLARTRLRLKIDLYCFFFLCWCCWWFRLFAAIDFDDFILIDVFENVWCVHQNAHLKLNMI